MNIFKEISSVSAMSLWQILSAVAVLSISGISRLILILFLTIPCLATAENQGKAITLTFEAGRENNSIELYPVGNQRFVQTFINGIPIIAMKRDKGETNVNWHFNIGDRRRSNITGDVFMTVDHIATDADLRWVVYDSSFHEYHNFPLSQFPDDRSREARFPQLVTDSVSLGNGLIRLVFPLRKARFTRRVDLGSDFLLHPDKQGFVGIRRIILRFQPVDPSPQFPAVELSRLLGFFIRTLWNRSPDPHEIKRYGEAIAKHDLHLFQLMQRMLYSNEFREKNFLPFENSEAVHRLFKLACGRQPTQGQFNSFVVDSLDSRLDFGIRVFVEKFYSEMIENALKSIRRESR